MNTHPLVSVIMPVYNGEAHLATAIESILCQTLHDFEFIIIDDGSIDGSSTILRNYQLRDQRIKLVTRENKGLQVSLNEGITLAQGKFIARMDCDDISLPTRLEKQLILLNESDADICGCWIRLFGCGINSVNKYPCSFSANNIQLLFGTCFAHPSIFARTGLLKSLKYSEEKDCKAEDYDLWVRCAHAGLKLTNVQEVLLLYRQHQNQLTYINNIGILNSKKIIQHKHWKFSGSMFGLSDQESTILFNFVSEHSDNDKHILIDSLLARIIKATHNEARSILFDNLSKLFCKRASIFEDPVKRWLSLQCLTGFRINFKYLIIIFLASTLSHSQSTSLYKIYNRILRRLL